MGELEFPAGGLLCLSAELGDGEDGDLEVLGEVLEGPGVFADELPPGSPVAGGGVDEADVVDECGCEAVLAVEEACGGYEVSIMPKGVTRPVRPTWTAMSSSRVRTSSGGYL